jgi:O-antigen/teichoic acid export membrane protein
MGSHRTGKALMNLDRVRQVATKFSSAVIIQVVISASSFLVGLIFIRRASSADYGHYVLVTYAILLMVGVQNSFLQPPLILRLARENNAGRADLIGGLLRGQQYILFGVVLLAIGLDAIFWFVNFFDAHMTCLALVSIAATSAALFREFFRMVLMTYHRPGDVLKADAIYVTILTIGALIATESPYPAIVAIAALAAAAAIGGLFLSRVLWRFEPWNPLGKRAVLFEMAPIGRWSTAGSALHWAFSQGYNYLAAGMLSVASVGALASTRLLLTPLNLVSTGIGSLMLPTASQWLREHGPAVVFRRLIFISTTMAGASLCYICVMWFFRSWIFTNILKKQFEHQDLLLMVWSGVFLLMLFRDQLLQLPSSSGLYRQLAAVTLVSTIVAIITSYLAIKNFGVFGAPMGVLVGELSNLIGIVVLSLKEIRLAKIVGLQEKAKTWEAKGL